MFFVYVCFRNRVKNLKILRGNYFFGGNFPPSLYSIPYNASLTSSTALRLNNNRRGKLDVFFSRRFSNSKGKFSVKNTQNHISLTWILSVGSPAVRTCNGPGSGPITDPNTNSNRSQSVSWMFCVQFVSKIYKTNTVPPKVVSFLCQNQDNTKLKIALL